MKKIFNFYGDPGHGWLAVPRKLLLELGIAVQISCYSYQRNETVYLEEDCDYSVFLEALRDAGIVPVIRERHADRRSKIRSYDPYRLGNWEVMDCYKVSASQYDPRIYQCDIGRDQLFMVKTLPVAKRLAEKWHKKGYWASVYNHVGEVVHEIHLGDHHG